MKSTSTPNQNQRCRTPSGALSRIFSLSALTVALGMTMGCPPPPPADAGQPEVNVEPDAGTPDVQPDAGTQDAGPTGPDLTCADYCEIVTANCAGDNAVYADNAECLSTCNAFTPGSLDDRAGDTLGCRIYHAGASAGTPATHCPHASAEGGGVCVDPSDGGTPTDGGGGGDDVTCAEYCTEIQDACTGDNAQFADEAACLTYCNDASGWAVGTRDETSGDTLSCRDYHAGVASTTAPETHCNHAGPSGGDVCGDYCTNYCDLMEQNCDGTYANRGACETACAGLASDGAPGDAAGDTVQCRIYHAGAPAAADGAAHCPHAAENGGGVCVAPDVVTCAEYCTEITAACTGDNRQYTDEADCLSYCNTAGSWPVGTRDETSGDTLSCRDYHATVAAVSNPAAHCAHAGPTGGDVCGDYCTNYCDLMEQNCDGTYANRDACETACTNFATDGASGDASGDTVQCRIYHAGAPAVADGALHCPHADLDGGGVCIEDNAVTCAEYCTEIQGACLGNNQQYTDEAECLSYCNDAGGWRVGTRDETSGDSLSCREYHASVASLSNPETHCPHAGPSGGDVCGDYCTNYCDLMAENCSDAYATRAECTNACSAFRTDGAPGDTSGDNVQCRIYHAGGPAAADGALHCPHAGVDGAGVCVEQNPVTCAEYCGEMNTTCTGENAQYTSEADCLSYCNGAANWGQGFRDDTSGNTLSCRDYHVGVASTTDPAAHCGHAGPSGGDVCGDYCTNYCDLMEQNCDGTYADRGACETACTGFRADGTPGEASGDTVQCRIYHAGGPAAGDAALHCPHAGEDGGGVCQDPNQLACNQYCALVGLTCNGNNAQYTDEAECLNYCNNDAALQAGAPTDTTGNTSGCRTYHADAAESDPVTHCPHAGPSGGGVCGDYCTNYCDLMALNCDGAYADRGACETACSAFPTDGTPGATGGDNVQCRVYHAGTPAAADGTTHCPHAGADGGGVCVN